MQTCIVSWSQVVQRLLAGGQSQRQIAAAIGVDQATVSRIASGQLADVRFDVGVKLLRLAGGDLQLTEPAAPQPAGPA